MEKKLNFILQAEFAILFCVASSVCKIDIKLYFVSFLKDLFVIQDIVPSVTIQNSRIHF